MIAKLAFAGALALSLLPLPDSEFPRTITTTHPYVEKIQCLQGSGTGFKLRDGRWVTVNHVSRHQDCRVDGKLITVTHADEEGDFSLFTVDDNRTGGLEINCEGFKDRQWVFGIGHGRGFEAPQIVAVRYSAIWTVFVGGPWSVFEINRFVPGMSGGPVIGQDGRVVGTVNAFGIYNKLSFSRSLSETVLCRGPEA